MKNKVNYKPANKVRTTKIFVIVLACISLLVSIPQIMEGSDLGYSVAGVAIGFFLLAGILEGFAAIVEAACEYSWEFDHKYSRSAEPKMDDSEVQ